MGLIYGCLTVWFERCALSYIVMGWMVKLLLALQTNHTTHMPYQTNNDTVSLLTTVSYMKGVRKPVKCSINEISRSVHILRSVRCKGCVCVWVNYCKFREILRKFL